MINEIFIKCMCSCSGIQIVRTEEGEFEVSLWTCNYEKKIDCMKERLRWCWNVLRTGRPWADEVLMSDEDAARLMLFLKEQLKKSKTNGMLKNNIENGKWLIK